MHGLRWIFLGLTLAGGLTAARPAQPQPAELAEERIPLDQLLTGKQLGSFLQSPNYPDRLRILRQALEQRAKRLDNEIRELNLAVVFRTLAEIRGVVAHATELAQGQISDKEKRHREVKRMEITLRKIAIQLGDQKMDVPLEERHQFEITVELAESLRNRLLRQLFGSALGKTSAPPGSLSLAAATGPPPPPAQGLWDRDRFTELEFSKIQYAQQLVKRVDVFLEIAESRLRELERRRDGVEWTEKEENPLEFYTLDDLVFAYTRAVDGIMVNIDSQVERGQASEKDVRKALRKFDDKLGGFVSRLEGLKGYVEERRDPEFAQRWEEALKTSEIARRGIAYGLGKVGGEDKGKR
jgi:hypothetical protein